MAIRRKALVWTTVTLFAFLMCTAYADQQRTRIGREVVAPRQLRDDEGLRRNDAVPSVQTLTKYVEAELTAQRANQPTKP